MSSGFILRIGRGDSELFHDSFVEAVELGRQRTPGEPLLVPAREGRGWRIAVARIDEVNLSRKHLQLEAVAGGIRITNESQKNPIYLGSSEVVAAGESLVVAPPISFLLPDRLTRVDLSVEVPPEGCQSLLSPVRPPTFVGRAAFPAPADTLATLAPADREAVAQWLPAVIALLQSAATSNDFFERAAQGVIDVVGLDAGALLLLKDGRWDVVALKSRPLPCGQPERHPSTRILSLIAREKRTFWQTPQSVSVEASLMNVQAVVASPVLDARGDVVGALYGDRCAAMGARLPQITKSDAMLVEAMASGVALGLARLEHERAAMAAQVRFEQFFSPELSRQLAIEPDLLEGRDTEVTVMFCDIRGFSRIADMLGPTRTVDWISDVLGGLSDCVIAHSGVLVDYIGDELMAMWGAPQAEPRHAELACAAARDMLLYLPQCSERWTTILGEPTRVGIGLNSGIARVGNTGTTRRFKYGPLGGTVNVASRVQGATKHLKVDLLITGETRAPLAADAPARYLGKVRMINIREPVALYEMPTQVGPEWQDICTRFGQGLAQFERQEFQQAAATLRELLAVYPNDGPSAVLLARTVEHMSTDGESFSADWVLPSK